MNKMMIQARKPIPKPLTKSQNVYPVVFSDDKFSFTLDDELLLSKSCLIFAAKATESHSAVTVIVSCLMITFAVALPFF